MSYYIFNDLDVSKYRSIVFHGKNSMTDMGLMMTGSTPLIPVSPKTVREEIAYADGDLDLSKVDGKLFFKSREVTYTFVSIHDFTSAILNKKGDIMNRQGEPTAIDDLDVEYITNIVNGAIDPSRLTEDQRYRADVNNDGIIDIRDKKLIKDLASHNSPVRKNRRLTEEDGEIYAWLYLNDDVGAVDGNDILPTELYDYAFEGYKFTNVSVEDVQVGKAMVDDVWIQQIQVKIRFDPYLQSLSGTRVDICTFVDRAVTSRNTHAEITIFNNKQYYRNDAIQWLHFSDGVMVTGQRWRYSIRIPYGGVIGMWFSSNASWNGTPYAVTSISGDTSRTHPTTLNFLDNDRPGQVLTSRAGGYCYVQTTTEGNGYHYVHIDVTFEKTFTTDNPPHMYLEWGVLRNYSVPDQKHYSIEAYLKDPKTAKLYLNGTVTPSIDYEFSLQERPINIVGVLNEQYDGLYKLKYDTLTRRL